MKKLYILLVVLAASSNVNAQVQSNCTVPPELLNYYERDIKHLAVCRMFEIHSPDTVNVTIPSEYIDTIAEGMAGIVNAIPVIPEADSVFNLYCVHNIKGCIGEYNGFLVKVDTSYAWTDAWQNLQTMTGDPLMDTIITRYSLYIQQFYYWSTGCVAVINSDSTWNLYALCDTLEMVPGVLYAHKNSWGGDGPYISYQVISEERNYNFSFEWGDCMAGCIYHYIWKFKVSEDCIVTFLEVEANNSGPWGDPLPAPINCNIFVSLNESFPSTELKVYPNPVNDKITISSCSTIGDYHLSIYTINGQKVMQKKVSGNETQIDISTLPGGVYIVKVMGERMVQVGKVIKW